MITTIITIVVNYYQIYRGEITGISIVYAKRFSVMVAQQTHDLLDWCSIPRMRSYYIYIIIFIQPWSLSLMVKQ